MWQKIINQITIPFKQAGIVSTPDVMWEYILNIFSWVGINNVPNQWLGVVTYIILSIAISFLGLFITRLLIRLVLIPIITRSKNKFDDLLIQSKVFRWLARTIPLAILYIMLPEIFEENTIGKNLLQGVLSVALTIPMVGAVIAILNTLNLIYEKSSLAKERPIKAYTQIAKIAIVIIAILISIGAIFDIEVLRILGGLGAFSAVLLLIFRDPILALVASAQLSLNKMVSIGDWIEVPGERADGTVIDMHLQSVRIQNWDKSIISVPIYDLISRSFINWRGMAESGGRRIKRSIIIDVSSVKFCTQDMIEEFKKYKLLKQYIVNKEKEISSSNSSNRLSPTKDIPSSRSMTNLGTFRAYAYAYLQNHPQVNHEMICMVRQRQPTDHGIPLECYCFSAEQEWVKYESVQSDIFDHLIAVIPVFGLRIFQSPSGHDFQGFGDGKKTHTQ